ncbi:unnamed protein product [Caenorhabditis sp. 36 PRJEB53466]|nr:unnamed protein product [Caenorhabditis sp. 36 PRJEB53466]
MNLTYIHTPDFLISAYHVMTCVEVPVHMFAFYCILFKTPAFMRSVKWSMCNLHFWSMCMDVSISLLTAPFVLYPSLAGLTLGILKDSPVPTTIQVYLIVGFFNAVDVAFLTIFENRYNLLFAQKSEWSRVRIPFLALNYTLAFVTFIPSYLKVPEQSEAVKHVFETLPELPSYLYTAPIFVLASDFMDVVLPVVFMIVLTSTESFVIIRKIHSNMNVMSKRISLSKHTFQLHKRFLMAICVQVC